MAARAATGVVTVATVLLATLLCALGPAAAQPRGGHHGGRGHRRGPPRGPIKGDQSHFFGKEGDHRPPAGIPVPTVLIAVALAVLLVVAKVYFKPAADDKKRSS